MVTIKDVAKLAGVSITSASYALNGNGTIGEDTRKRVLAAAETLNYHPNAHARNLKRRSTLVIGVFITRFGGSFYEEILEGIHDVILDTDYELIVCPESKPDRKLLTQRQVDGAIVFDSKIDDSLLARIVSPKFPVIVLDRHLEAGGLMPLLVDNAHGARQAFAHLHSQGYRKISFISGAPDSFDNSERMQAFLEEAERHNLPVITYQGYFTEESGHRIGAQLAENNQLPDAVFCANDQMAIGFMRALQARGLQAPQDVAVVGFDDIQIARYLQPSLSTIGASRQAWGAEAATQLIHYLEDGRPFAPARIPTHLVVRQSSVRQPPAPIP